LVSLLRKAKKTDEILTAERSDWVAPKKKAAIAGGLVTVDLI
jgi:hypothetical protein